MGRRSAKIALRKGKSDAKKSKIYGKFGKKLVSVIKAGGADPQANSALADLLKSARELGVPKDILDRGMKRANDKGQADYQSVVYEAYGPGGTGFVVECLTDNLNRSASEVKAALNKGGAKVAEPGSVLFNFSRMGLLVVQGSSEDAVFEAAMEAGVDDVVPVPLDEEDGSAAPGSPLTYKLYTSVENWGAARSKLAKLGCTVDKEQSELVYRPTGPVDVNDEAFTKCEALLEKLLELDDVDGVYHNCADLDE